MGDRRTIRLRAASRSAPRAHVHGHRMDPSRATYNIRARRWTRVRSAVAATLALLWPVLAILGAVAVSAILGSTARAQRRDSGLDLARLVAHEASLDAHPDEVAAIALAATSRCEGCSIGTAVRVASRRFFAGTTSRPYYLELRRDGRAPASWPSAASWSRWRPQWLALLAAADAVVAGERRHACESDGVTFWGMRGGIDLERAIRNEWVEVDCSSGDEPTANAFYRLPSEVD